MSPLIITNDLQLPSLEQHEEGGGSVIGVGLILEENIGTGFLGLEDNIGTGTLELEDNI